MSISLVISTLNEEKNISDCINSAKKFVDEIIVCDQHSEDKTVEIAKSLGAKIIYHEKKGLVDFARFHAITQASHEWILILDADEQMTEKLGLRLKQIANENKLDAVSFASLFNYFGGPVYHGVFFSNNWTRFFRKSVYIDSYSENEKLVHQEFSNLLKLEKRESLSLDYYIHHNAYPTIEKYINKTVDFYARVEAKEKYERGEKFAVRKMLFEPIKTFIMSYFIRRGFMDGTRGLILNVFYALYRFNVWANLWFLEQKVKK